jgi:cytochrome c-type biogenesis protein CcmH/NrfF
MRPPDSRRAPFARLAAALFTAALLTIQPAATALAQQQDAPHPPPDPGGVTSAPGTEAVTKRVLCPCGTCVNQTLHECTCGTAAMERRKIADAMAAGRSADDVVESYVQEYGLQVLSSPDRTGFNLLGWMVPFVVTLIALAALILVITGWMRASAASRATLSTVPAGDRADASERAYRERLERDLDDFEA